MPEKPKLNEEKEWLAATLTQALPSLRASLPINKTEFSNLLGVSWQNYHLVESRKRAMTWSMFVPIFLYFMSHEASRSVLRSMGGFEKRALDALNLPVDPSAPLGVAICLYCGSENQDGVKFCGECGTKIGEIMRTCDECGAQAFNGAKYCGSCGKRIV